MNDLTRTKFTMVNPKGYTKTADSNQVFFALEDESDLPDADRSARFHEFFLDKRVWVDMGHPETITVTVEAGDKLNEEEGNV